MLAQLQEHIRLFEELSVQNQTVRAACGIMADALRRGGKILIAGNGGSAADAQHFAAELVGRFQKNRRALPCLALNTDTSNLTALGNDFGFDTVFARQVEALGKPGDVFIGISTSGNSENIIAAAKEARRAGLVSVGLLGRDGGSLAGLVDYPVIVPHQVTARIQEAHIFILHYWAGVLEDTCA
ncbi:MAG: D-sedoheptulose 7-phosphate isomerase [Desulfovibrionaceae bacterium]|nr:D-sedoheptulose 7-phosphate isomerase [Desulfovibrionaceae bacterium]